MSSYTARFFVNDKRISTAVLTRKGEFLQVYPSKQRFPSENDWRSFWQKSTMVTTKVEITQNQAVSARARPKKMMKAKKEDWVFMPTTRFKAPAGTYYIGDLCYALSDEIYDKIFGLYEYESGIYKHTNGKDFFLVDQTSYGDGCYTGSDGKEFCVDAGIIGICPTSLAEKDCDGGHIYTFTTDFLCTCREGRFTFTGENKQLIIDTRGELNNDDY